MDAFRVAGPTPRLPACDHRTRVSSVDVSQIVDFLRDIVVLVNCAGPFSATVKALVDRRHKMTF